jgi:response regulator NasT
MVLTRRAALDNHHDEIAADITRRLRERNLIERAKGRLMLHRQMTESQAHRWIQRMAMHRRVRMARVATGVIDRWFD